MSRKNRKLFIAIARPILFIGAFLFVLTAVYSPNSPISQVKQAKAANTVIFLTSGANATWNVPSNWNSASNTIEVIGAGGGGATNTTNAAGGGGGGGYSKVTNLSLTPGGTATYTVQGTATAANTNGGQTWFNSTTCAGSSVCANGGTKGTTTGGAGGSTTGAVGGVTTAGGTGGNGGFNTACATLCTGGGGGGAAGPSGVGKNGGAGDATTTGDDGGGGGGGSNGATTGGSSGNGAAGGTSGGAGGNGISGSGSGAGGSNGVGGNGTVGGGGGGGDQGTNGGNGGDSVIWTQTSNSATAGTGGGGGGAGGFSNAGTQTGGNGGSYGGGGGGGEAGGTGGPGIIVITYAPTVTISGTIKVSSDETTTYTLTNPTVKMSIGGATASSTTASSGNFSFTITQPNSGDIITIWLDTNNSGINGSIVLKYGTSCTGNPSCTGLSLILDRVSLIGKNGTNITNTDLSVCDNDSGTGCTDTDIGFTSNAGAMILTGWSANTLDELKITSGTTYAPAGAVNADKLDVTGAYSGGSETITLSGSGTTDTTCTANTDLPLCVAGTFTVGTTTVDYTSTSATNIACLTYATVRFRPASGSPTYTLCDAGSQTITAATLTIGNGTNAVTTTAATNNPAINVSGIFTISASASFSGGSSIITLSGNGTPWVNSGTFTYNTSTIKYTNATSASIAAINMASTGGTNGYYYLSLSPASGTPTYTLGTTSSQTIAVNGDFSMGGAGGTPATTAATNNPILTIGGSATISTGTFTVGTAATTISGALNVNGTLSGSGAGAITVTGSVTGTGTINITGNTFKQRVTGDQTFGTLSGANAWTFNNLTFSRSAGTPTISTETGGSAGVTVNGTLSIGEVGDGAATTFNPGNKTWTLKASSGSPLTLNASSGLSSATNSSTFLFDPTTDGSTVTVVGTYYNNVNIDGASSDVGAGNTFNWSGDATLTGLLTIGHASSTNSDTLSLGSTTVTFTGSGNYFSKTTKGIISAGTSLVSITGTGNIVGDDRMDSFGNGSLNDVTINSSGTVSIGASSLTIKNLTISAGTFTLAVSRQLNIDTSGSLKVASSAALTSTSGAVLGFLGNGCIGGTGASCAGTAGSITIVGDIRYDVCGAPTLTIGGTTTIITSTITLGCNSTLNAGSSTINITGTGTPFTFSGSNIFTAGTGTISYKNTTSATVASLSYYNLDFSPASGTPLYDMGAGPVTVDGNMTLAGAGNATVDADTFNDPTIDINGSLTIGSGDTFIASATATFTIARNLTVDGTFTHSNGTIIFDTTGESQIDGNSTSFYGFTSTTSGKTLKFKQTETITIDSGGLLTLSNVTLTSISGAGLWIINHQGTEAVSTVSVAWSDCDASSTAITVTGLTDGLNNDTAGNNCWGFVSGISIQGTVYKSDGTTIATAGNSGPCDGSTSVLSIRINGGTAVTGTCTNAGATFNITTASTPTAGDTITIYLTSSMKGNTVYVSDANADSGINVYENTLTVGGTATTTTILDILDYDNDQNATDMLFDAEDAAPDTLITEDGVKLTVLASKTFTPGGTVTTSVSTDGTNSNVDGDVEIQTSGTLNMGTNALSIGGDYKKTGAFSSSSTQTTTFTATATGHELDALAGELRFYNLVFNGTNGGWALKSTTTIETVLTITAGNVDAESRDIGLNGTGTPFVNNGTFTYGTSTVRYYNSANVAAVNMSNIGGGTNGYYNLAFTNSAFAPQTNILGTGASQTIGVNGSLSTISLFDNLILDGATFDPTITISGDATIYTSVTLTAPDAGGNTISVGGNWTNFGTFTHSSNTVKFTAANSGHTIDAGSSSFYNVTFDGASGVWSPNTNTMTIAGDLTMTNGTLNGSTGTPSDVVVNGHVQCGVTCGTINFTATNTFTQSVTVDKNFGTNVAVATNWSFYNLTFTGTTDTITTSSTGTGTITVTNVLTISGSTTLAAGNRTWVLSSTGTPFVKTGTFTYNTSTINYTGNGATMTNLSGTGGTNGYYNLGLKPGGATAMVIPTGTLVVNHDLTIGNGTNAGATAVANDPIIDVNGSFSIAAGATFVASDSASFTIAGNFTDAGTFTHSNGTVTFDTTGASEIDGNSTVFYNFNSTTSTKALKFKEAETVRINGLLTLTGVTLNTITGASTWTINFQGTKAISSTTITRSACDGTSLQIDVSTGSNIDGGNNGTCWVFITGVTISGNIFQSDTTTPYTAGVTVAIKVNGAGSYTDTTTTSGAYSISGVALSGTSDVITVYFDSGGGAQAVAVTHPLNTTSDITTLNLFQNHLILRDESTFTGLTNTSLNAFDNACNAGTGDTDLNFCVDAGNLTVSDGSKLLIQNSVTFLAGGNVTTSVSVSGTDSVVDGDVQVEGILDMEGNQLSVGGDYVVTGAGLLQASTGAGITMTATGSDSSFSFSDATFGASTYQNISFTGAGATWSISGAIVIIGQLYNTQTLNLGSSSLTFAGSGTGTSRPFRNAGTVNEDTSSIGYTGSADTSIEAGDYYYLGITPRITATLVTYTALGAINVTSDLSISPEYDFSADYTLKFVLGGALTVGGALGITNDTDVLSWVDTTVSNYAITTGSLTIEAGSTLTANGSTITLTQNGTPFSNNGVFTTGTSTVRYTSGAAVVTCSTISYYNLELKPGDASAQTICTGASQTLTVTHDLTVGNGANAGATAATNNPTINVAGNMTVALFATYTAGTGTLTVTGDLAINGSLANTGSTPITVNGGDLTGSGTINLTAGTLLLDGTGNISNTAYNWTFYNLTLGDGTGAATTTPVSNAAGIIISNVFTIAANQTYNDNGEGLFIVLGGSGTPFVINGTYTAGAGEIFYAPGSAATIAATTYNGLGVSPSGNNVTVSFAAGTTTAGYVYIDDSSGGATPTLSAATNASTVTVSGNVSIATNTTLVANGSNPLSIGGSFYNDGAFTHSSGTIAFTGATTHNIGGGASTTFNNISDTVPGSSLLFQHHTTNVPLYTIAGTLTVTGSAGNEIVISSDNGSNQWLVHFNSAQSSVTYANISYSGCDGTSASVTGLSTSINSGNNGTCWSFVTTITVSGTSNGTGTVKVAVNTSFSAQSTTISGGNWTISGVTQPTTNDVVTVWIDGVADGSEATAVTKYDGTGNITGMVLNANVLTIGSADNPSVTVTNLGQYDADDDEDVMHTANSSQLAVQGGSNSYSDETINILTGATLTIGGSEFLFTDNLTNAGTLTSGGASSYYASGNVDMTGGTFTQSTSTINLTGGATTKIVESMTASDGTELSTHTGELNATWEQASFASSGKGYIYSNRLTKDSGAAAVYFSAASVSSDQYVQAKFRKLSALSMNLAILARLQATPGGGADTDSYYWLRYNNDDGLWTIRKTIGGTATVPNSNQWADTIGVGEERTARLEVVGTTITAYIDGVQRLQVTDAALSGGYAGFRLSGNASSTTGYTIDDFEAGNVDSAASTTIAGASNTFYNLNISPTTLGTVTMQTSDFTVSNQLSANAGATFAIAANRTLTLSGSGTPLSMGSGAVLSANASSIVKYTGTSATTVASTTYGNLELKPAGTVTYTLGSGTLATSGNFTAGNATNAVTVTAAGNNPPINVTGNFVVAASAIYTNGSNTVAINGDFTNSGTFNAGTGTVTINPTGSIATISGSTTFNNFSSTTAGKTIKFKAGDTFTFNGLLTLTGATGNNLIVTSDTGSSAWTINHQGTELVDYITLSWSSCSVSPASTQITTSNSTNDGNNGACWLFAGTISVSGTSNGAGTVALAIEGVLQGQTGSISNGTWSISGVTPPTTGNTVVVFFDNSTDAAESTAVTLYDGTGNITGMVLNTNVLTIGSADNQSVSLTNLDLYDCTQDEDIMYQAASSTLRVEGDSCAGAATNSYVDETLSILASNTLTIGASESFYTDNIVITGTLSIGGSGASQYVSGNWTKSGTYSSNGSTISFTATDASHTIDNGCATQSCAFYDLNFNGVGGSWSFSQATQYINNNLTVTEGTLSGTSNITAFGDITGDGTINLTAGTFTQDGSGGTATGLFGGKSDWTFYNLTLGTGDGLITTGYGSGGIIVNGTMTIATGQAFNAGLKTWTLAKGGTPLVNNGTFNADTSTFKFTDAASSGGGTVTIYEGNLQSGAGTDNVTDYARQVNILAGTGVDIVAASEVWGGNVSNWDTQFTAAGFSRAFYVGNNVGGDPSATLDGQAVWYRTSTVTLNNFYTHALSTNLVGYGGTHVDKSAGAVDVTVGGKRFYVVSAHLCWSACADEYQSTYSQDRVTQINELNSWIGSTLTGGYDIVLAGDMNFGPDYPKCANGNVPCAVQDGYQEDLLTNNYNDIWRVGLANGTATANWGDRDSNGQADMPVTDLTTRTHDTRRIDYFFLNKTATSLSLNSIDVPDLRATCPHGLVAGGVLPSCEPEVSGGPTTSGNQWDIEDDFGVRPSDHNFVKSVFNLVNTTGAVTIPALTYYNLQVNNSATTFTAAGAMTTHDLTVSAGTFIAPAADLTVTGSITNNGTFNNNSGTVIMAPTSDPVDVTGTTVPSFNNLTISGGGRTVRFKDGSTINIAGAFSANGSQGSYLRLASTVEGSRWLIHAAGSVSISILVIQDAGCSSSSNIGPSQTMIDAGNNDSACWKFIVRGPGPGASGGGSGGGRNLPDTFTAANETSLTSYSSRWSSSFGSFAINTNAVYNTCACSDSIAIWTGDSYSANQYAELTLTALNDAGFIGVTVRGQPGAQSGYVALTSGNALSISKFNNGTEQELFFGATPFIAGDTMRLEMSGTTLTLKRNGSAVHTFTDSTFSSGSPGLSGYGVVSTTRGDNFDAGSITSGGGSGGSGGGSGGSSPLPDGFTDANSTSLTTHNSNWSVNGGFAINTNSVYSNNSNTTSLARWTGDTFNNNQYAQVTISAAQTSGLYIGVAVRVQSGGELNAYGAYTDSSAVKIMKWISGTPTELYSGTAFGQGDVLRLEISGTTLTLKQNGSTITTVTVSNFSSGSPGLSGYGSGTGNRVDDFSAGSVASGGGGGGSP